MGNVKEGDWSEWKRIQHSMCLEGWKIDDGSLWSIATEYEVQGYAGLADKLARKAEEEGCSLLEAAKEIMDQF